MYSLARTSRSACIGQSSRLSFPLLATDNTEPHMVLWLSYLSYEIFQILMIISWFLDCFPLLAYNDHSKQIVQYI